MSQHVPLIALDRPDVENGGDDYFSDRNVHVSKRKEITSVKLAVQEVILRSYAQHSKHVCHVCLRTALHDVQKRHK